MKKPHILMVEDDKAVRQPDRHHPGDPELPVPTAEKRRRRRCWRPSPYRPDVMLLDLGLPDMDGVDIIKKVRTWSNLPIIVISARSEDSDKVAALDAGADDYLTKPFSVDELLARLRVALRRVRYDSQKVGEASQPLRERGAEDRLRRRLRLSDGQEIHLTPIEYKLLCLLARNTGKVLTHNYILKEMWGSALPCGHPLAAGVHGHAAQKDRGRSQPPPVHPDPHRRGLPHDPPEAGGRGLTSAPASLTVRSLRLAGGGQSLPSGRWVPA